MIVIRAGLGLALGLLALYLLGAFRPHDSLKLRSKALAVVTFLLLPIFAFWQQYSYAPAQNQPSVTVSPSAALQTAPDGSKHWVVMIKAENKSAVRSVIILSNLIVCQWVNEEERARATVRGEFDPQFAGDNPICKKASDPFAGGSWIDANASLTFLTSIPADPSRPLIEVDPGVLIARGDRYREVPGADRNVDHDDQDQCTSVLWIKLQEPARYRSMLSGDRGLLLITWLDGGRNFTFGPESAGCPGDRSSYHDKELESYYSVTEMHSLWAGWSSPTSTTLPGVSTPTTVQPTAG